MKALSIRQPWLALLLSGEKPVEFRTWSTRYRGPLLLHAGARRDEDAPALHLDAPRGALLALAELVGVESVTSVNVTHLARFGDGVPGDFAWHLRIVRTFAPVPWRGALGLFEVSWSPEVGVAPPQPVRTTGMPLLHHPGERDAR